MFENGGSWEFLLRKPLLTALYTIHEYTDNTITIENKGLSAVLQNQIDTMKKAHDEANKRNIKDWKKHKNLKGREGMLPSREVLLMTMNKRLTSHT